MPPLSSFLFRHKSKSLHLTCASFWHAIKTVWDRCSKFRVLGYGSKWSFDVHLQMFNIGTGIEKKYSSNKLYHCDHKRLLVLAIYIVCRLNQYKTFTKYPFENLKRGMHVHPYYKYRYNCTQSFMSCTTCTVHVNTWMEEKIKQFLLLSYYHMWHLGMSECVVSMCTSTVHTVSWEWCP